MESQEEKNWNPWKGPRLSLEEAHRSAQLRTRLTELRYLHLEYPLRRASSSRTKSERIGWWSVWAVSVFVEHQHRFPRQGELYPYLHKVLDESKTLEDLKLPPLEAYAPSEGASEATRTTLESLQHDSITLSIVQTQIQAILRQGDVDELVEAHRSDKEWASLLKELYDLSKL